jgi:hypothetical protein
MNVPQFSKVLHQVLKREEDNAIELELFDTEEIDDCSSLDDEINTVALGAFSEQAQKTRILPKIAKLDKNLKFTKTSWISLQKYKNQWLRLQIFPDD